MNSIQTKKGFSLMELMIALAIVAILAMIAVPSYQDSMRKSRRTDAKSALTEIAALQEKYYFKHNVYSSSVADLYGSTASKEGYYTVALDTSTASTGCGAVNECFIVTAEAAGSQLQDTTCKKFTLMHNGFKSAIDSDDASSTSVCW